MTASTPMWARVTNRDRGSFASFTALPESANDGDIACIPQLVGSEMIRMRYVAASARWAVEVGQVIASALDPFAVVGAGAATNYDKSFCTIPAWMWGENEEWEFAQPTETVAGNIGTVTSRIFLGSFESTWPIAASRRDAAVIRYVRRNNNPRRRYLTVGQFVDYGLGYIAPDMSQPIEYRHRLSFSNVGDSGYIIHSHIRRSA